MQRSESSRERPLVDLHHVDHPIANEGQQLVIHRWKNEQTLDVGEENDTRMDDRERLQGKLTRISS